ncbi:hypothetical protein [Catenulispora subtropica]|uniref:DUF1795 domain-containing protein n=1 Tax=Catenulispora subtropica TaxID=450798 RepID=A0ABP5E1D9_9ACTN
MSIDTNQAPTTVGDLDETGIAQVFQRNAAVDIPPMHFEVPVNFLAYPLQEDPAERDAAAYAFARELYKNGDEELWRNAAPAIAAMGEMNAGAGIGWAGMGVFDNEQGGVASCTLTVAATESDHMDPEIAALGLREALVRDEFNDSRWLNLPCGPAVSRITVTKYTVDPELSATGEAAELVQGQIQVYVPFPTGPWLAILTMQSANMEAWVEFSQMMAMIVNSISFPGAAGQAAVPGQATAAE